VLTKAATRWSTAAGAGMVASLLTHPVAAVAAPAGDPVICPPSSPFCIVSAEAAGAPAPPSRRVEPSGRRNSASDECRTPGGIATPCYSEAFGTFNASDGCYYRRLDPQPPPTDAIWAEHGQRDAVYQATCVGLAGGTGGGWVWLATPPATAGGAGTTPAQLAQQAVRQLELAGPTIRMAPPPGSIGVVNAPVWLWTDVTARTWGPATATASVPGLSVTARATGEKIEWQMGDGSTVTCTGPGDPYVKTGGAAASPTCGHVYRRSSADQPDLRYTVTATTTWRVAWEGGGDAGVLTATRTSTAQIQIAEVQVLS
jgi:hypothetical protein